MVNELLFGERMEVLEVNDRDWARIRCEWDEYEGWCKMGQLAIINKKEYRKGSKYISWGQADKAVFEDGDIWLPAGAELTAMKGNKLTVCDKTGKFKGKKASWKELELNGENLIKQAQRFMNAPYVWGGRTVSGIDCSGLTQMAFKLCGKAIKRDADQQAEDGEAVDFLQHARCGDLAFFNNADGKIVHVGILLDEHTIIHATDTSGRVVIDKIDPAGIVSRTLKKRTHELRLIKRFF
jgi:cell wall-associated NlpC family hydrolase